MSRLIYALFYIIPVVSSSAALMCSLGQQLALSAFLHPRIPASARHTLFYPWLTSYARVVYLSGPCHLTTVLFCLLNLFFPDPGLRPIPSPPSASSTASPPLMVSRTSSLENTLWVTGLVFTLLHAYPLRLGLRLSRIGEQEWTGLEWEEGKGLIGLFTEVNARRLGRVDFWGWAAVVGAAVLKGK